MPQPTVNDVHVDQLLSNVAISYRNTDYVADQHFPVVPVNKQSNVYASFDQSAWFRDEAAQRSPGTLARVAGYPVTTNNQYVCLNYSLSKSNPREGGGGEKKHSLRHSVTEAGGGWRVV